MNSTHSTTGRQGADSIAESLELRIRSGSLSEGERLPSIRSLAEELSVSPATVAAAYRRLRARGLIVANRLGTVVAPSPELPVRSVATAEMSGVDLSDGNPDASLLPDLGSIDVRADHLLYGEAQDVGELMELGREMYRRDGVDSSNLAITGGSHDGVERALATHLLPGDSVGVEDPGYAGTHDLVRAMGLKLTPVPIDREGMLPQPLDEVLKSGVSAVVMTNRAQNATGAALTDSRSRELATVLGRHPDTLVIEDDHAGPVSGARFHTTIGEETKHWVVVRSFGKYLAPDLRVAILAGDELTVGRMRSKQLVGTGWVSQLLQRLVVRGLTNEDCLSALEDAERSYTDRRTALESALRGQGLDVSAPSGFNVWIPVERETEAWSSLHRAGWIVAPGENFRLASPPGIRITISRLSLDDIEPLAASVAEAVKSKRRV